MAALRKPKKTIKETKPRKLIRRREINPAKKAPIMKVERRATETQELSIEKAKFFHPERALVNKALPQELPSQYGQDKIALQVRDPRWIYAYWEIKSATLQRLRNEFGAEFLKAKRILRVYDVTNISFNGANFNRFFDIGVGDLANNWYINTDSPGRSWCVDLGLVFASGRFVTILRSNIVQTPLDGPSGETDEEWLVPEEMFARLYGLGFGLGQSSPVGRAWQERARRALFSGVLASPMTSPIKKPKEKKFWLTADCELIVYGATEPDAKVTIQDKPLKLRQDGTFSLRLALPDGKQVINIKAVSKDNKEERSITPIVKRETR